MSSELAGKEGIEESAEARKTGGFLHQRLGKALNGASGSQAQADPKAGVGRSPSGSQEPSLAAKVVLEPKQPRKFRSFRPLLLLSRRLVS